MLSLRQACEQLKRHWDENPLQVAIVGAFVATAAAKVIDALSAAQGRRAYAKQIDYKAGSGRFYSQLMGREFRPGRVAVLLDFVHKEEGNAKNGLLLAE